MATIAENTTRKRIVQPNVPEEPQSVLPTTDDFLEMRRTSSTREVPPQLEGLKSVGEVGSTKVSVDLCQEERILKFDSLIGWIMSFVKPKVD